MINNPKEATQSSYECGHGPKRFDLSAGDVNLESESPFAAGSGARFTFVLVAGRIVGVDEFDNAFDSVSDVPAGSHLPFVFKSFSSAASTAVVICAW